MRGPLVSIEGGIVILNGNPVDLAPNAAARPGAMPVRGAAEAITLGGNTPVEPAGDVPLLRNWTGVDVTEAGNSVPAGTVAVANSGTTYHRLRNRAEALRTAARDAVGAARHQGRTWRWR